ncbi:MAG: hypothetical protein WD894_05410 [Pirellulales bacterium]
MSQPLTAAAFPIVNSKLRELLDLLAALRAIRDPLSSPEGLRASLALLLRLAEFAGVDRAWTDRVRAVLDDPRSFDIVLAIVRYLHGLMETEQVVRLIAENDAAAVERLAAQNDVAAQDFLDWLPLILEIIALLREFRRAP